MTTPISFDKSLVESIASSYARASTTAGSSPDLENIKKDDVVKNAAREAGINVDDVAIYDAFTRAVFDELNKTSETRADIGNGAVNSGDSGTSSNPAGTTTANPSPEKTTQTDWTKWRGPILLVLGVLAVIGSIFSSEQGGRGKPLMAAIGGFLIGAPLIAQWGKQVSWLSWLLGGENGGEQKPKPEEVEVPKSPVTDGATPTQG